MLHSYDVSEEVEKTRGMTFLEANRDEKCVDDVIVNLIKDGLKPEGCWVRIIGLGNHLIMGTLLNETEQDFGYHTGETIRFFAQETEDKKVICYSDMNESCKLTEEDLEDGSLLEEAVSLMTIVLNAFREPFVLDAQIWDMVEIMKSRSITEEALI